MTNSITGATGFVYLLHFRQPISPDHTTQHYLGFAHSLPARIQAHLLGNGARLTQVAKERGIPFEVVRIWRGDRALEKQLKRRKNAPRLCPKCGTALQGPPSLTTQEAEAILLPF